MWFVLVAVAVIGYLLYILLLSKNSPPAYWKKHGIQYINSSIVASNLEILMGKKSIMDRDDYAYQQMGSSLKFCGVMETPCPVVLVKDLELVKKIMIKDFDHFVDRRDFFEVGEKNILGKAVFMMRGEKWRSVRTSISPAFTTGKIRRMMEHFESVSQEFVQVLLKKSSATNGSTVIDVTKSVSQYTVEMIATSVFGIRSGAVQDPNALFCKMANRLSDLGLLGMLKMNIAHRYPKLLLALGIEVFDQKPINFFEKLLRQSLEARINGSLTRNDFQQLLLDVQKGKLKAADSDELDTFEKEALLGGVQEGKNYFSNDMIVANSIVFFLAGVQTTTGFISFAMYVLAAHPDIQEKLREEVDKIVKEDGSIGYDDLNGSTYLDMFTSEVLRLYPPATRLEREAAKDYYDSDSGMFLPKGSVVAVPLSSIHRDPKYYPNPERFDPENFSAERKASRSTYSCYIPFGIGPRSCIGIRFALVESKAVIAHLVHRFRIEPTEKTPLPVYAVAAGILLFPPTDLELKLIQRQS